MPYIPQNWKGQRGLLMMEWNLDVIALRSLHGTYSEQRQDYHVEFLVYVKAMYTGTSGPI